MQHGSKIFQGINITTCLGLKDCFHTDRPAVLLGDLLVSQGLYCCFHNEILQPEVLAEFQAKSSQIEIFIKTTFDHLRISTLILRDSLSACMRR